VVLPLDAVMKTLKRGNGDNEEAEAELETVTT
jgi:hypothetical protein